MEKAPKGKVALDFIFTDKTKPEEIVLIAIETLTVFYPFSTCNKETNCRQSIYHGP